MFQNEAFIYRHTLKARAKRELQRKQDLLVREVIQALFGRAKSVTVTFHMEDS